MAEYEPTPEQVEAAAIALSGETREYAFYEYPYSEVDRDRIRTKARAVLTAAGPLIAAQALRAHRRRVARFMPAGLVDRATVLADLDDYANRIEKEADRG